MSERELMQALRRLDTCGTVEHLTPAQRNALRANEGTKHLVPWEEPIEVNLQIKISISIGQPYLTGD